MKRLGGGYWEKEDLCRRFYDSVRGSEKFEYLDPYGLDELGEINLFKVRGESAGFAIKGEGDIVLVHNNTGVNGIGSFLVKQAVLHGGRCLNHFDGFLSRFYGGLGFVENRDERLIWDDGCAPRNWKYEEVDFADSVYVADFSNGVCGINEFESAKKRYKNGMPDVIMRHLK